MTGIAAIGAAGQGGKADSLDVRTATTSSASDPSTRVLPYNMVSHGSKSGELSTAQQFESFVLQSFIEPMLPKEDSSFFGEGTAGSIWKSMLAERIGAEMAASGGIGIAAMVEKRNASIQAMADAKEQLRKDDAVAKGAGLGKPGVL